MFALQNLTELERNSSDNEYTPYGERVETYIVPVIFLLIFLIGVLGNGTLVAVYLGHPAMRDSPNTFIFSLAVADLLVILICVPFVSIIYTLESWPWGGILCRASEFAKDVSIGVSVFTLTALSAERFCAIINPFQMNLASRFRRMTLPWAVIIWVIAILCAIPAALFSNANSTIVQNNRTIYYCTPYPPEWENYPKWMTLAKAIIYYACPLGIIAFFYSVMAYRLLMSTREMSGAINSNQHEAQTKIRKSVACMVLIFVIIFFICFLPYHAFELWFHFSPTAQEDYNDVTHAIRIVGFCLSFLNSCVNPVALYFISATFHAHFNSILCRCSKKERERKQKFGSQMMTRSAIGETSFRNVQRRNQSESIVISNVDFGSTRRANSIMTRNGHEITTMTIVDTRN